MLMHFLEKDLEDLIWDSRPSDLIKIGFPIPQNYCARFRQTKIGNYGISDIIYLEYNHHKRRCHVSVCELKKDKVDIKTFSQAVRYCKGLSRFLSIRDQHKYRYSFDIILCGRRVSTEDEFIYLADLIHGKTTLKVLEYDYTISGLKFTKKDGFCLLDEGFSPPWRLTSKIGMASPEYIDRFKNNTND